MKNRPWVNAYPASVPPDLEDFADYETLPAFFESAFARLAEQLALKHANHDLTYLEVDRLTKEFASYLQNLGIKRGTRVAVALPNSVHYIAVAIGTIRAGMVLVNVNPTYTPREYLAQIADAGAEVVVVLESQYEVTKDLLDQTAVSHAVLCDLSDSGWMRFPSPEDDGFTLAPKKAVKLSEAMTQGRRFSYSNPQIRDKDIAVLQYTGGTTGVSKGAMLTHASLLANTAQNAAWFGPSLVNIASPTIVCALPLYHIVSFITLLASIKLGGRTLLISDPRDAGKMLAVLRDNSIHMLPGINTLFGNLMNHADFKMVDWSHLKVTTAGGMATQPRVARRWFALTGCNISEGYGLSETSGTVSCNPPHGNIRVDTVGLPVPSTEIAILDGSENALPLGEIGQIAVRGPQLFSGYWGRLGEAGRYFTDDGFFLTGDLGYFDEHNYLCISGRAKEMILVSGFNVYPNEVEAVTSELEQVLECAAVGIDDEFTGEAVKLVVVLKDSSLSEMAIREHLKANLAAYKRPKVIEFREKLPRSPVGKLLRSMLVVS